MVSGLVYEGEDYDPAHQPYRTSSHPPKEPEPMIPFADRHPHMHKSGKAILSTVIGMAVVAFIVSAIGGFFWGLGYLTQWLWFWKQEHVAVASVLSFIIIFVVSFVVGGLIYWAHGIGKSFLDN
jgi:CBS domain containing-hemolysin-like protein